MMDIWLLFIAQVSNAFKFNVINISALLLLGFFPFSVDEQYEIESNFVFISFKMKLILYSTKQSGCDVTQTEFILIWMPNCDICLANCWDVMLCVRNFNLPNQFYQEEYKTINSKCFEIRTQSTWIQANGFLEVEKDQAPWFAFQFHTFVLDFFYCSL